MHILSLSDCWAAGREEPLSDLIVSHFGGHTARSIPPMSKHMCAVVSVTNSSGYTNELTAPLGGTAAVGGGCNPDIKEAG